MNDKKELRISEEEAKEVGKSLGVDWDDYSFEEFLSGINIELEHGTKGNWDVTDDDLETTAKIALAHLDEIPDYYTRLKEMEDNAKEELSRESSPDEDNVEEGTSNESLARRVTRTIGRLNSY